MKRIALFLLLALVASTSSWAQKTTLSGTLTGLPDEAQPILCMAVGNQLTVVDTLRPDADGYFRLTLAHAQPSLYVLQPPTKDGNMAYLMLEPKDKVTVDMTYLPDQKAYRIDRCKGSANVELYRQFNDLLLVSTTPQQQQLLPQLVEKLLAANPKVLMSAFLVTFFDQDFENHAALYAQVRDALLPTYPDNVYVKNLVSRLQGVLLAGAEAPDIALEDPDGQVRRLSDLRGQVVLLDFWASWCSPCRRENPNVVRLYQAYHDKGFEIFSVSLDSDRSKWLKAIRDDHLTWPNHVSDLQGWNSAGGKIYGIRSIPSTVLIDREGKIIARNLRGADLENKLKELFQ